MIKLKDIINEILSDWKSDVWVHYTDVPYLKINPKQAHGDPTGIYLFPVNFAAKSDFWAIKKYTFYVKLKPNIRILDVAALKAKDCEEFLKRIVPLEKLSKVIPDLYKAENNEQYFEKRHPFDVAWEFLQSYFIGQQAKWNDALRKIGYDAIFDDTLSIHSREVQMLILDPTKIDIVKMETRKGTGYEWVLKVAKYIKDMVDKDYDGYWIIQKPKKKRTWGNEILEQFMMFSNLPHEQNMNEKYRDVVFRIYPSIKDGQKTPPYEIYVYFSSTPSKSYGIGARFNIIDQNWEEIDKLKKEIDDALNSPVKYKER